MTFRMERSAWVALLVIFMAALCALLLAWPGQTVTTRYVNDLFIFLDGVHRVRSGQVPNVDFHTALGPLVYYAPAAGYWLSGNFGGAMPVGIALLILSLALPAAHILSSRLTPVLALPLAACLFLVAAVPINIGESIGALSFAMFYNRIGWSALGFLLVMYLHPTNPRSPQKTFDAVSAALLVTLMLYIKISYGIVGIGFLIFLLLDKRQRAWSFTSLCLVAASCLLIDVFWQGTKSHFNDLMLAGEVSGSLKTLDEFAQVLFKNFADFVIYAVFMGLALWSTRSARDLLFFGFCAGSGYLLIMQNFQASGVMTLAAGAAVAVELMARSRAQVTNRNGYSLAAGAHLLFLAFVLPASIHNGAALGLHAGLATLKRGDTVPLPNFEGIRLAQLWSDGDYPTFSRYLASIGDGARALSSLKQEARHVFVLDFVSPFSAGLGLKAPHGDSTWYHWGRTVNEFSFLPAKALFEDVRVVMEPKWPVDASTAEGLKAIYADYIEDRYELAEETADWKIYVLRAPPAETVSRYRGFTPDDSDSRLIPSGG